MAHASRCASTHACRLSLRRAASHAGQQTACKLRRVVVVVLVGVLVVVVVVVVVVLVVVGGGETLKPRTCEAAAGVTVTS